jgi:hypothetical protein
MSLGFDLAAFAYGRRAAHFMSSLLAAEQR